MDKKENPVRKVLVYDPSKAIPSYHALPLKAEGIELICTQDLGSFRKAVSEEKYDGLIALIDYGFDPEAEKHPILEETIKTVSETQKSGGYPLLIDFITNFKEDEYNQPTQNTRSSFDSGLKPLELPYTKEELLARFSKATYVLQRPYLLEKLKKHGLDLMFPRKEEVPSELTITTDMQILPPQNSVPEQAEDGSYVC